MPPRSPSPPLPPPTAGHVSRLNPPSLLFSRPGTSSPARGSVTQTITETQDNASSNPPPTTSTATLRLRGAHDPGESGRRQQDTSRIRWAEDVVDNEGMGRKRSKVCCIYHRPRQVGESSSEEDSSSSSSDESSSDDFGPDGSREDDGVARPVGGGRGRGRKRRRHHHHVHDGDGKEENRGGQTKDGKRKPSPNAYERMPKTSKGPTA